MATCTLPTFLRTLCLSLLLVSFTLLFPLHADANRTVRAGIYNFKPLVYSGNEGGAHGFYVEVFNHIAALESWDVQYVSGTWQEGLDRLKSDKIDLLICIGYTEERDRYLDFPKEFLLLDWGLVYKPKGSAINTIMDLEGKTVSVLKGSVYSSGFQDLVRQFNLHVKILETDQVADVFKTVDARKADAGVTANLPGILNETGYRIERTPIIFTPVKLSFAVNGGKNGDLIMALDQHIAEMKADRSSIYYHELEHLLGKNDADIPKEVYWLLTAIAASLLLAILFVVILKRQVRRKTSELKNSTRDLVEQGERLASIINGTTDAVFIKDALGRYTVVNDEVVRLFNLPRPEIVGHDDTRFFPPEEAEFLMSSDKAIMAGNRVVTTEEYITTLDGKRIYLATKGPVHDQSGSVIGLFGISRDITESKQNEEQFKNMSQRLQLATAAARLGVWDWNVKDNTMVWDDRMFELYGVSREAFPNSIDAWLNGLHPDDRESAIAECQAALSGEREFNTVFRVRHPDGSVKYLQANGLVIRGADGTAERMLGINSDITELKYNQDEKAKLELQLHQAQKMESVGSLAGGVAHDFNNKLSVILGHAYLALSESIPPQVHDSLEEIRKAAEQSADLTRQLLAFARKQTIAPKVLDLNEMVTGMFKMLTRLIGEDIQLTWKPAPDLWLLKFDPSQIDQILANLCVNARDSISDCGTITIETGNCTIDGDYCAQHVGTSPGEYVRLVVSDNGCGMDAETLDRIFEPFFTTKETGKGTGLGLATTYGIVKQNNGFINVYSEPGLGTTFSIYLPRFSGTTEQLHKDTAVLPVPLGRETILLVEDELSILNMATMILTRQGYTVLEANSPADAVRLAHEHRGEISLLITDVIMPEMNGKELTTQLQSLNPQLKCLYMSGYTADAIAQHGVLDAGVNFIQKPFSLPDLATKVRKVLDAGYVESSTSHPHS